jgi:acyl-CoA thioesterase
MTLIDYEAELLNAIDLDQGRFLVPEEWMGMPTTAFGGFVVGGLFVAAAARASYRRPLSIHARFHRPVPVGRPIRLVVEHERQGRAVEAIRVALFDEDRSLVSGTAALADECPEVLASQTATPMQGLEDPVPTWKLLEDAGIPVPNMMKRVGFRRPRAVTDASKRGEWHLHADWPATYSDKPSVRAAVAIMCLDAFVAPATMVANGVDAMGRWPAIAPSIDIAAWFHDLSAMPPPAPPDDSRWLRVRTTVPATGGGFAVGRTQVWSGERLAAEGLSQVRLIPF